MRGVPILFLFFVVTITDHMAGMPTQSTPVPAPTTAAPIVATPTTTTPTNVPVIATPVSQSITPTQEEVPTAFHGPDTSSFPETVIGSYGNWIKKRSWWKDARDVSIQIATLMRDILDIRKIFSQKYTAIGDTHYDFYQNYGFEQGKLNELFASIDKYLEKQRKRKIEEFTEKNKQNELSQRDLQNSIDIVDTNMKSYKVQLEQLKLDLKSIEELDQSLLERLKKVDEHLEQVKQDNTKIAEIKETLVHIVDHNKARDLYYKLKNEYQAKLENIKTYLSQTLMQDFDKVSGVINAQIEKAKESIKKLEEKKLYIKDRATKIADIKVKKIEEEKKKEEAEKKAAEEKKAKAKVKKVEEKSWLSSMYDFTIDIVTDIVRPIKNFIYGEEPKKKKPGRKLSSPKEETTPVSNAPIPQKS